MADRGHLADGRGKLGLEETVFAVVRGESVHGVAVGDAGRRGCGGITEHHKRTRGHVSGRMEGVRLVFRLGHIFGPEFSEKRGRGMRP